MQPINQTELRKALEERISNNKDLESHQANLDELPNHSITIIQNADLDDDFNCVMYALNFRLENPTSPFGKYYANTKFLEFLIKKNYLSELTSNLKARSSYAIYYQDADIQHIGVVCRDGLIESKWGAGHLYKHKVEQVPSSYGNIVRYFESINENLVFDYLIEFHKAPY